MISRQWTDFYSLQTGGGKIFRLSVIVTKICLRIIRHLELLSTNKNGLFNNNSFIF